MNNRSLGALLLNLLILRSLLQLSYTQPLKCSAATSETKCSAAYESYTKLTALCREISMLSGVFAHLEWDERVMMPKGAASLRAKQKAMLAALVHEKQTSSDLRAAIDSARKHLDVLDAYQKAVIRDTEREFQRTASVPADLEKAIVEQQTLSVQEWAAAREKNDFASYARTLNHTLELTFRRARYTRPGGHTYDNLVDFFERGMSSQRVAQIFEAIRAPLKAVLNDIIEAKVQCRREIHPALRGGPAWDVPTQVLLVREIALFLGFDLDKARIDTSVHPFAGGSGPQDVRITTRYDSNHPLASILFAVHEIGHAFYEQGRNADYEGLPVSQALSMGVHESQSLLWERMIARSLGFWQAVLPIIHKHVPHTKNATAEDFFFSVNQVNPSLIRIRADEVTYPFHIILRFELEEQLASGRLLVADLPQAWNSGMKEYLGVDVPSDHEGCLQDVHWPSGLVGYFPSYAIGAMMAAQLFSFLKVEVMPDIDHKVRMGNFSEIREWLQTEIHERGSLYASLDELLTVVTGEPLNPSYFIEYLSDKYAKVYGDC